MRPASPSAWPTGNWPGAQTGFAAADIEAARLLVLDWLGSALAGIGTDTGRIFLEYARLQPAGKVTLLGLSEGRSVEVAALVNGALSHIVEMDDVERESVTHPGAVVVPAALAVAERVGASGLELLAAVVAGYEIMVRVGAALGAEHYYHFHNTSTAGVFGAAAAAGWLLDLDRDRLVWALGNAGTQASGLWQFNDEGALTKPLHPGRAAANGVLAATLSRLGLTGARHILEGERGFFAGLAPRGDPQQVVAHLGEAGRAAARAENLDQAARVLPAHARAHRRGIGAARAAASRRGHRRGACQHLQGSADPVRQTGPAHRRRTPSSACSSASPRPCCAARSAWRNSRTRRWPTTPCARCCRASKSPSIRRARRPTRAAGRRPWSVTLADGRTLQATQDRPEGRSGKSALGAGAGSQVP